MNNRKLHKLFSSCLILCLVLMFFSVPVAAASSVQMISLGGTAPTDPLRVDVYDNGSLGLYFLQGDPGSYVNQYFGGYAWGSNIFFDRSAETLHYGTQYYSSYSQYDVGLTTLTQSGNSVTGIWTLDGGNITFTQIITYVPGSHMFSKVFRLTNNSAINYTNVKFIHGGDTYFGGSDSATCYWNELLHMVYVRNADMTQFGLMGFAGQTATPPDQYFAGNYWTGYQYATSGDLPNTAVETFTDAGYQLQWNNPTLAAGSTWEIQSFEMITEPNALQVIAPAGKTVDKGTTTSYDFIVQNFSSENKTYNLTATSANGWATTIPGGASIMLTANGGYANVNVTVAVPAGAADGMTDDLTLTATDAADPAISSSNITTTTVSAGTPSASGFIKVQPTTILTNPTSGIQTVDLEWLVSTPDQWQEDTSKVEFWLDTQEVTAGTADYAFIGTASTALSGVKLNLLKTFNIDLMQRVTKTSGAVAVGKVGNADIKGNITVRIPIPTELLGLTDLGIVYIDETGATATLTSKRVTIGGVDYLEFANNHFSVYGIVSGSKVATIAAIPKTGEHDNLLWGLLLLAAGSALGFGLLRKRNVMKI